MDRRLRMAAELGDWLAELSESEPATAAEVGAALLAVLESGDPAGLAIVGQAGRSAEPVKNDPRETVDDAYQRQLAELQRLRRRVTDVATARRAAELALNARQAAGADAAVLAAVSERLAAARLREADLSQVSQRAQIEVDAFRTAKETAKARFTAAEASLRVAEVVEALDGEPDPDLAERREDYRTAAERLRELRYPVTEWSVDLRKEPDRIGAAQPPAAERPEPPPPPPPERAPDPVSGLLELRADPLGSDIRFLLAEEPAGTVTLLAVLDGPDAVREQGTQAVTLAGELLTEIRDDDWPADVDEVVLADSAEFVARFFPAGDDSLARRAAVLAAMTSLQTLRADLHLTIEEVAARSGLRHERIEAIEREGLRAARVHEAVALARALGARLELTADDRPVAG
ncbi:MAG: helix-turn-helix transcriptional regulator [Streptosporangiaceae bacterium]